MNFRRRFLLFFSFIFLFSGIAVSQTNFQQADRTWRKKGVHNGNLLRTLYFNWGEVARWPDQPSVEWPKGSGNSYVDGVTILVATEVTEANGFDRFWQSCGASHRRAAGRQSLCSTLEL